jgi:hypothetical protein
MMHELRDRLYIGEVDVVGWVRRMRAIVALVWAGC